MGLKGHSIIGTWFYFSPALNELNVLLGNGLPKEHPDVRELIVDGNLYSLQAVMLQNLIRAGGVGQQCAKLMNSMWNVSNRINAIYESGCVDRFAKMQQHLETIWSTRKMVACEYIRLHPKANANDMFSLLLGASSEKRLSRLAEFNEASFSTEIDTLIAQKAGDYEVRCVNRKCCNVA